MHIAVTGASGFVGSGLIPELEVAQHTVLRFGRGAERPGWRQWDPITGEPELGIAPPLDAIVHLAGEPVAQRWTASARRRIADSRIVGTRNLVRAIGRLDAKPRVLVAASAIGLYGDRGDQILDETAGPSTGFLADVCQRWEEEADRAVEIGVRVVKIRIGLVLGLCGGALGKMFPPFKLGLGARIGDGSQWMSWILLDDLSAMIRYAMETDSASGVWNGVAPNPVTNAEFTRQLAAAVRRPAWFAAPKFLIRIGLGEMSQILLESQRCIPAAPLAAGFRFRCPELGPALRAVLI
ncbi:MAG: TIGR01777 family protein [Acidobacteria bacterium]|nr:TIGR01777 family protein [Acidobacteriota bacterium]